MSDQQDSFDTKKKSADKKTRGMATEIDRHVGKRLKIKRNLMGLSQDELAKKIGVTFQQIQKYEHGTNRISAGKLYEFARMMETHVGYFFDGLDHEGTRLSPVQTAVSDNNQQSFAHAAPAKDLLERKETTELIKAYYAIDSETVRHRLLQFVKSVADTDPNSDVNF